MIEGVNVAILQCDKCGSKKKWIFKGMGGEGYKIVCADCKEEDRKVIDDMGIPYLWKHLEEATND